MGRKKVDRSDKVIQTFESSRPLILRLKEAAQRKNITVSALIREILEKCFENRKISFLKEKGKNCYGRKTSFFSV